MPRIRPVETHTATGKAKNLLETVQATLGNTSDLVRTMAHSPAVLDGYLQFCTALDHSALSPRLREQIALALSQANDCQSCLAAHTAIGRTVGLGEQAIRDSRRGDSSDKKEAVVLQFVRKLVDRLTSPQATYPDQKNPDLVLP